MTLNIDIKNKLIGYIKSNTLQLLAFSFRWCPGYGHSWRSCVGWTFGWCRNC